MMLGFIFTFFVHSDSFRLVFYEYTMADTDHFTIIVKFEKSTKINSFVQQYFYPGYSLIKLFLAGTYATHILSHTHRHSLSLSHSCTYIHTKDRINLSFSNCMSFAVLTEIAATKFQGSSMWWPYSDINAVFVIRQQLWTS